MGRDEMRAGDADRQAVAEQLRTALSEGRLDLEEFDERLRLAYAAKTYGDLKVLLTDLPTAAPLAVPVAGVAVRRDEHVTAHWLAQVWNGWLPTLIIMTVVWGLTSLGSGHPVYYWPVWVAGPWGAVLLMRTISGLTTGEPRRAAEERARQEIEKQERKERMAAERAAKPAVTSEAYGPVPPPDDTPVKPETT